MNSLVLTPNRLMISLSSSRAVGFIVRLTNHVVLNAALACLMMSAIDARAEPQAELQAEPQAKPQAEPQVEPQAKSVSSNTITSHSKLPTPPQAQQRFTLELSELSVNETKPNGERWDFGFGQVSRPDLTVQVQLNDELILKSKRCRNTFSCSLTERSEPFELRANQAIIITVADQDLKRDDMIDQLTLRLSPDKLTQSRVFKVAGKSVSSLVFTLKRVTP